MTRNIAVATRSLTRVALVVLLGLIAEQAMAQTIQGISRPLEGTHWKAIELAGKSTPAQDANREAHLLFQAGGRVTGSDGCNRITGSYEVKGDVVTFGQMAGTRMACSDTAEIERAFRDALKGATRLTIVGDRLELFDVTGKPVAVFTARPSLPLADGGRRDLRVRTGQDGQASRPPSPASD